MGARTFFPGSEMGDTKKYLAVKPAVTWPNDCPDCQARMEFVTGSSPESHQPPLVPDAAASIVYRLCPCGTKVSYDVSSGKFVVTSAALERKVA